MGDFDFSEWDGSEPRNRYTGALKAQGFKNPTDRSPFKNPPGWHGGQVDQTGGMVMVRTWSTKPSGRVGGSKARDIEYEVAYGSDPWVSVHKYRWNNEDGYYDFAGEVETVSVDRNTDEAKGRAARRLMKKHSGKTR